jgi:hypothetical protein
MCTSVQPFPYAVVATIRSFSCNPRAGAVCKQWQTTDEVFYQELLAFYFRHHRIAPLAHQVAVNKTDPEQKQVWAIYKKITGDFGTPCDQNSLDLREMLERTNQLQIQVFHAIKCQLLASSSQLSQKVLAPIQHFHPTLKKTTSQQVDEINAWMQVHPDTLETLSTLSLNHLPLGYIPRSQLSLLPGLRTVYFARQTLHLKAPEKEQVRTTRH